MYKDKWRKLRYTLDGMLSIIGIVSLAAILALVGFNVSESFFNIVAVIFRISIYLYLAQELARFYLVHNVRAYIKDRMPELILSVILILNFFLSSSITHNLNEHSLAKGYNQVSFGYLIALQLIVVGSIAMKALRYNHYLSKIKLHPSAIFALSFALIITVGTLLLLMPKSVYPGVNLSFIDSLFTSTSAVCVTGLSAVDTPSTFSFLGKLIILGLIQIGGLGVMTITTFFAILLQGQMSIGFRIMMSEFLSNDGIDGIKKILKRIAILTFSIEAAGAFLIYISLGGGFFKIDSRLFFTSVFHSISAFCNAGFSLYSDNLMTHTYSTSFIFPTTVMCLIVLGGLGFHVLTNILNLRSRKIAKKSMYHQLTPNTKLVLSTTLILIIIGAVVFSLVEPFWGTTFFNRVYSALFLSVTSRTAGFNTFPTEGLGNATVLFTIVLMWIGASPGSTGGGIKTTTFAIAFLSFVNLLKGKEKVEVFQRHVLNSDVRKAFMIIFASLIVLTFGCTLLMLFEPDKSPMDLIFEATSALGTVGLSRNLTFHIGTGGKAVLTAMMFIGRIGSLAFFLSFFSHKEETRYNLPQAKILIG